MTTVLFGLLCTIVLNVPSLWALHQGTFSLANLGLEVRGSADEVYYAALIRDVAEGYTGVGNVSFYEHRFAQSVLGYTPLLQGLLMRLLHSQLVTAIFAGDLIFPFLAGCITYLLMRRCEPDTCVAFFGAAAIMAWKGGGWLRTFSPQITGLLFLIAILTLFSVGRRSAVMRGACIGMLLLTQPTYAAFLLIAEGLLACLHWKREGFASAFCAHLPVAAIILMVISLRLFFAVSDPNTRALADTYRRLGLIPSHLPAAPRLQLLIIMTFLLYQCVVHQVRATSRTDRVVLPLLLVTSFLSLWLSLFIGVDGNFGLYYTFPIRIILWIVWFRIMFLVLPKYQRTMISFSIATVFVFLAFQQVVLPLQTSDIPSVVEVEKILSLVAASSPTRIIAAPLEISNFVPVFTPHYTLFTQYAHFQYASDQELAERYLTLHNIFPLDPSYTLEGNPLVFGLYAGNLSARERTWCRILLSVGLSAGPCSQRLVDFIYHQDVRRLVEAHTVDTVIMLKKYGVNTVIADKPLPPKISQMCVSFATLVPYTLYNCNFGR